MNITNFYLYLKGQKLRVLVVNIKDTILLQKYVHIYLNKVFVTQDMIIKHNFILDN